MRWKLWAVAVLGAMSLGCGSSNNTSNGGGGGAGTKPTLTITNFTFEPAALSVTPGSTITVTNKDSFAHTVTSETTQGAYTPGAVNGVSFDTGSFTGTTTITIPSSAAVGTVIPYYCQIHKGMMANAAQAQITVVAAGADAGTGGGGGGGGGGGHY